MFSIKRIYRRRPWRWCKMPVDALHWTSVSACNSSPFLPPSPAPTPQKYKKIKRLHIHVTHMLCSNITFLSFLPQWQRLQRSFLRAAENLVSLGCPTAFELSLSNSPPTDSFFLLCTWQERPGLPGGLQAGPGLRLLRRVLGLARVTHENVEACGSFHFSFFNTPQAG